MSFVIRSRTTTENCVTGALCNVYLSIRITTSFSNLMNTFNPPTTKLFRPTFTAKGDVATPWICDFRSEVFSEIVHEYVFGVKKSNGDSENFLSLSRDLET